MIGDVSKSLDQINLGKKTNQNFVNLSNQSIKMNSGHFFYGGIIPPYI